MLMKVLVVIFVMIMIVWMGWLVINTQVDFIQEFCLNRTGLYNLSGVGIQC